MQVDQAGSNTPTTGAAPAPTTPEAQAAPGGSGMPQDPSATVSSAPSPVGEAQPMAGQSDAVPIRLDVQPPAEDEPKYSQQALRAQDHVTFTGDVRCEGCLAPMVLRVLPFQPPGQLNLGAPPSPLTTLAVPKAGPFELSVPRGAEPVVLELLVDLDQNGRPDRGERLAVVVKDGHLTPDQDRAGFVIDASDGEASPWGAAGGAADPSSAPPSTGQADNPARGG